MELLRKPRRKSTESQPTVEKKLRGEDRGASCIWKAFTSGGFQVLQNIFDRRLRKAPGVRECVVKNVCLKFGLNVATWIMFMF